MASVAMVTVTAGGRSYSQVNDGLSGYLSHSLIPLYFGLGSSENIEKIEIVWPSGKGQLVDSVELGKIHTIVEP